MGEHEALDLYFYFLFRLLGLGFFLSFLVSVLFGLLGMIL